MPEIKFYARKAVPVEMHKVKIVQKLSLLPARERLQRMYDAGFNTFGLHNSDIFMDMLTDSGTNAMSDNMQSAMLQDVKFKIASLAFQKRTSEAHDLDALVADIKNITDNRLQAARGLTCQLAAMCAERLQKGSANAEETLAQCARSIKQLSPEAILVRGFAAVSTADGRPVASVEHVKQNDTLIIRLRDGKLRVTIEQIERS